MSIPVDIPCPHVALDASVSLEGRTNESDDVVGFNCSVRVWCKDCSGPFEWVGCEPGLSPFQPMVDMSNTVLNAPLRPPGTDAEFGSSLPVYRVRVPPDRLTQDRLVRMVSEAIVYPNHFTPALRGESPTTWSARAVLKALET